MVSNSVLLRLRTVAVSNVLNLGSRRFLQQAASQSAHSILPVKELTSPRTIGAIYRRRAHLPPAARRFIEILKTTANELAKRP
jgi:DNA-binding transcriptional LysR family regulator